MKRTQDPRSKPFEIRTGIGMPGFRGMRTVGDPSFLPPTKFRYLQNIRLGDGDVKSRPGLTAFDTLGAPAVWLTEIAEDVQSATVYVGPSTRYNRLIYSPSSPLPAGSWMILNYSRHDLAGITTPGADLDNQSSLFGLFPAWDIQSDENPDRWQTACMPASPSPYIVSDDDVGPPTLEDDSWGVHTGAGGTPPNGFYQQAACIDALVKWQDREGNDRWLAPGQHKGWVWSGVGDYVPPYYSLGGGGGFVASEGDPTVGGQPIFEVNFDTGGKAIDRVPLLAPGGEGTGVNESLLYPGGLTEVFRMPPPGYFKGAYVTGIFTIPSASFDPDMYPNGEWVRSMVSVGRRADNLLTNEEVTEETLYIGTVGGKAVAVDTGGGNVAPVNDPTDGDVWAYDGITLEKVETGVGHLVCVAKTGDGGVLAAGRASASYLDEKGGTWQTVTYSPVPTPVPVAALPIYDQLWGYAWCSRVDFQGSIYLYGYDMGAGFNTDSPPNADENVPDRLVIGKFDPGTLTITIVRTGAAFSQAIAAKTLSNMEHAWLGTTGSQPVLAAAGGRLYYLSSWTSPVRWNVGVFDGSTWDDDFYEWDTIGPSDMVTSGQKVLAMGISRVWRLEATNWQYLDASTFRSRGSRVFVGP